MQKKYDGEGKLVDVSETTETVEYEIFKTFDFSIRVREGAVFSFLEKLEMKKNKKPKYSKIEKEQKKDMFIQNKMKKDPAVKLEGPEFVESFRALRACIFG